MVSVPKSAKQIEDYEKPQEAPKAAATSKKTEPVKSETAKLGVPMDSLPDPIPAHWSLLPAEDEEGVITATCSTCRDVFRGTVKEFNKALRNQ